MECVILAGGMGTRLRSVVSELPKCMAPVAGKPFLHYIVETLGAFGFDHIIFSLGYKHECIEEWIGELQASGACRALPKLDYVVETEPLGTGGGVRYAFSKAREESVFVLNGDTFFDVDFKEMMELHNASRAMATVALKPMRDFERYGTVGLGDDGIHVTEFREKQHCEAGLINGGVYLIRRSALDALPQKFSMEKDFFEKVVGGGRIAGYVSDGYFIDIGIPEDYSKAQEDFAAGLYKRYDTLFLDRDGVINVQIVGDYVRRPEQLRFIDGALEALALLAPLFARIVVVTNQRGVTKGLMSGADLENVHNHMLSAVEAAGGRIDRIYCCTGLDCSDPRRKPNIGMFEEARTDWPQMDLSRCFMVGDQPSDMEFAERAGLVGIPVSSRYTLLDFARELISH